MHAGYYYYVGQSTLQKVYVVNVSILHTRTLPVALSYMFKFSFNRDYL